MTRDIVFDVIEACCVFADMVVAAREPSRAALTSAINNVVELTSTWIASPVSKWELSAPGVRASALLYWAKELRVIVRHPLFIVHGRGANPGEYVCVELVRTSCVFMDAVHAGEVPAPPGWPF